MKFQCAQRLFMIIEMSIFWAIALEEEIPNLDHFLLQTCCLLPVGLHKKSDVKSEN
jgi:hypothetical protein